MFAALLGVGLLVFKAGDVVRVGLTVDVMKDVGLVNEVKLAL